jgi:hypothetical protein
VPGTESAEDALARQGFTGARLLTIAYGIANAYARRTGSGLESGPATRSAPTSRTCCNADASTGTGANRRGSPTDGTSSTSERGYDEMTLAEIADSAGVSTQTIFAHFPSEEDILFCTM